jgi:V/A-type H+-transporting ATPase subunit A
MTAHVVRVSGSLVEVEQLTGAAMLDMVRLGDQGIPGEVVAIDGDRVSIQAYEETAGLSFGAPVSSNEAPLSAQLGPGLLGRVFDGLLRPLSGAGVWLVPGVEHAVTEEPRWPFEPSVQVGQHLSPGDEIGTVVDGSVTLRISAPPGCAGEILTVAPEGRYTADAIIAQVGPFPVALTQSWPVREARPYLERLDAQQPLHTGQRVLDLLFPVARGSSAAVPGGFGTGKTVLLQQIAKWSDADVVVYVGCGERGNEMADVVDELRSLEDPRTGNRLADRTVVIANTSNMPMMARELSIYSGVTVAEYFRDMGYHVILIADSTSRWAEALREFASRTGALPAEEGYPAGLASSLAAFYERAGFVRTLGGRQGSVTIVGAVSPPGGDMAEPVTAHTQRFVRSVWTLDRDLAYARHYPAVGWTGSFSRDTAAVGTWHAGEGDPQWAHRRARVAALLADADRLNALAELVGVGALPGAERVVMLAGRLLREGVLQQSALSNADAFCSSAKGAALADAVLVIADRCAALVDSGVPAAVIEELDFGRILRAREETGPDDVEGVHAQQEAMIADLDAVS